MQHTNQIFEFFTILLFLAVDDSLPFGETENCGDPYNGSKDINECLAAPLLKCCRCWLKRFTHSEKTRIVAVRPFDKPIRADDSGSEAISSDVRTLEKGLLRTELKAKGALNDMEKGFPQLSGVIGSNLRLAKLLAFDIHNKVNQTLLRVNTIKDDVNKTAKSKLDTVQNKKVKNFRLWALGGLVPSPILWLAWRTV